MPSLSIRFSVTFVRAMRPSEHLKYLLFAGYKELADLIENWLYGRKQSAGGRLFFGLEVCDQWCASVIGAVPITVCGCRRRDE